MQTCRQVQGELVPEPGRQVAALRCQDVEMHERPRILGGIVGRSNRTTPSANIRVSQPLRQALSGIDLTLRTTCRPQCSESPEPLSEVARDECRSLAPIPVRGFQPQVPDKSSRLDRASKRRRRPHRNNGRCLRRKGQYSCLGGKAKTKVWIPSFRILLREMDPLCELLECGAIGFCGCHDGFADEKKSRPFWGGFLAANSFGISLSERTGRPYFAE